ncbi:MAG: hypothetical protein CVV44_05275 [Spirochaetae bacterium HGW-Spirochaetae-1]|jgi:hypothetical protein|nr:MAG: hypothetical protein CVV44_05275 [Spirochaetae bacterium HGW-Spirochaetae-1]
MEKSRTIRTGILLIVVICSVLFYIFIPRQNTDASVKKGFFQIIISADTKPGYERANTFHDDEVKDEEDMKGMYGLDPYILRREFPRNRALPAMNSEEQSRKNEDRERRNRVYGRIISNRASENEVHRYYNEQSEITADTVELLEFILDRYGNTLSEKDREKHAFLLDQYRKRLSAITLEKKESLERIRKAD